MISDRNFMESDIEKIDVFLGELYKINNNAQHSWLPMRWNDLIYRIGQVTTEKGFKNWQDTIHVWVNEKNQIVAVVNSEDPLQAHIQVHPEYRFLEEDMIKWAEENIAGLNDDGKKILIMWTLDSDDYRHKILNKRDYKRNEGWYEYQNINYIEKDHTSPKLPEGFKYLSMEDGISAKDKYIVQKLAFNSPISSEDVKNELESSKYYNKSMDLFTAKGEKLTSFCTVWYDSINKIGKFEPVGTHPDYRFMGLGKAVLEEGLRRLKALGAEVAYVDAGGENRETFYNSAGFKPQNINRAWIKEL